MIEFKEEFPQEIKKLAKKHKINVFDYDTFYNLLYDLSKFDDELTGKYLETWLDFDINQLK